MSRRWTTWLAWSSCAIYVTGVLVSQGLSFANGGALDWEDLAHQLVLLLFAIVGALVAARQPRNAVGWLLCAFGIESVIEDVATQYGKYALFATSNSLPAGAVVAWLQSWLWAFSFGQIAFLLLLFPNGRVLSRRWGLVARITAAAVVLLAGGMAFAPGNIKNRGVFESVPNPFGLQGLAGDLATALAGISFLALTLSLLAAAASMVVRFRRARGVERQQMKWFAIAASLLAAAFIVNFAYQLIPELRVLEQAAFLLAFASVPVSVGIAILRHRLYDIDRLINRAVVYGALSAGLGLVYWASVVLLQQMLREFTQGSELAIIASTLAVAAFFTPARRRIQNVVDRRFFRRKYDTQRTLEHFTARLRQEVDLERLAVELVLVADGAVQPAHASLWLRPVEHRPRPLTP
jgi:hypothetical protein